MKKRKARTRINFYDPDKRKPKKASGGYSFKDSVTYSNQ